MKIYVTTLLSYIEGTLSAAEQGLVESELLRNKALKEYVRLIRASYLPYPTAMALLRLPPPSKNLEKTFQALKQELIHKIETEQREHSKVEKNGNLIQR